MSKILVSDIYICILATNLRILKVIFKVGLHIFNREISLFVACAIFFLICGAFRNYPKMNLDIHIINIKHNKRKQECQEASILEISNYN